MKSEPLGISVLALCNASLLGLTSGILWLIPTLLYGIPTSWLALPIGWLLGSAVCTWISRSGSHAAIFLAAYAMLLAVVCMHCLNAVATLAGLLDISMLEALGGAGPRFLLQLIKLGSTERDLMIHILAILLAAGSASRRSLS